MTFVAPRTVPRYEPEEESWPIKVGARVRHARFGEGLVVGVERDGQDTIVTVGLFVLAPTPGAAANGYPHICSVDCPSNIGSNCWITSCYGSCCYRCSYYDNGWRSFNMCVGGAD